MIIWGSGGDSKDLGLGETRQCATCGKIRPFKVLLQYRFSHVYYIFGWITEKKYFLACDVCRHGWELQPKDVEGRLKENPIPFMKRYGWAVLVGPIAIILLLSMFQ